MFEILFVVAWIKTSDGLWMIDKGSTNKQCETIAIELFEEYKTDLEAVKCYTARDWANVDKTYIYKKIPIKKKEITTTAIARTCTAILRN